MPAPPTKTLEAPKEELSTGSTFAGRYQIIEELGKGGMGKVYKARDTEIQEKIALKLIKPEISADKKTIERFQNELKFARKIGHRNVCRMYDLNKEEGSYYITMEYVSGEDLKSFIRRVGQLPSGKAVSIAKQVTEGLAEAHRLGVIHRDLKPSNIMIDKDGNARIMDFGIARSVETKGITGAGIMIGTPEYMPPEQAEAKEVDQRSDIYSLGVILYEMLTGRVPFEGDTALSIAMKHKGEDPKDPREFNSQISEDLCRVILRCLEKEKDNRYQSASELQSDLKNIEGGIPTTERIIPEKKPLTSREITVQLSMKKLIVPVLVALGVVIIGFVAWKILSKEADTPVPTDKPSLGIVYFENNTGDENLEYLRSGLAEWFITDLSQSKFIRVLSGDRIFSILKRNNLLDTTKYTSEDLVKIAELGRVNHILKGGFIKVGDNFVITAMLHKPQEGEVIKSMESRCHSVSDFPSKVDELTKQIKEALNLTIDQISNDNDLVLGEITTTSPEAYKYYIQGREFHHKFRYQDTISLLEKALEIDPEFASCLELLGHAYGNMGLGSKATEYSKRAFDLSDQVSEREKYRIKGSYYIRSEDTYPEAIEAYSTLLKLYPDDATGNNMLGNIYSRVENFEKAMELYKVNVEINNIDLFIYHYALAVAYSALGKFEKASEVIENFQNNFDESASTHLALADVYIYKGELGSAFKEVDKAFALEPTNYRVDNGRSEIYLYREDYDQAEKIYRDLINREEIRLQHMGHRYMARLCLYKGQFNQSEEHIKKAIELSERIGEALWTTWNYAMLAWLQNISGNFREAGISVDIAVKLAFDRNLSTYKRYSYFWKGIHLATIKDIAEARKTAMDFKKITEEGLFKREIRNYYYVMARITLNESKFADAIDYAKKGLTEELYGPLSYPAFVLSDLGYAYYRSDNLIKAEEEYKRIQSLTSGRILFGDMYAKSFYMLGKIYEQQGDSAKALEHYEKFLDLWKDADPGIAEVDDARERLVGLHGIE
jgi:tetratricopeptide (TPR) repeat protein/tRNA A-37 threonylcarbamoyl transferase component Bud32